ncbi:MAG: hypothetical protein MUP85_25365, partial [Candidatus Lokiarchaeota archaeon]|nr:hypothetical protein [Candidatus Lokiarchaeota archaeon]
MNDSTLLHLLIKNTKHHRQTSPSLSSLAPYSSILIEIVYSGIFFELSHVIPFSIFKYLLFIIL